LHEGRVINPALQSEVVIRQDNKNSKVVTYAQHKNDFNKLIAKLIKLSPEHIVMEVS